MNGEKKILKVPLKRKWLYRAYWKRSKIAIKALREYLSRIYKGKIIKIDPGINEEIWSKGGRKPPSDIEIVLEEKEDEVWVRSLKHSESLEK